MPRATVEYVIEERRNGDGQAVYTLCERVISDGTSAYAAFGTVASEVIATFDRSDAAIRFVVAQLVYGESLKVPRNSTIEELVKSLKHKMP